eukprot:m.21496 g.21496  ORF g.21496 m.21496 type:complete len:66 (-) comp10723_c0_seq1:1004-1201(-)
MSRRASASAVQITTGFCWSYTGWAKTTGAGCTAAKPLSIAQINIHVHSAHELKHLLRTLAQFYFA